MTAVLYHIERPSGAPVLLVPVISTTTISLSWREVNCTERNGVIIGYIVQYSIVGGKQYFTVIRHAGANVTSTVIVGLAQSMTYSVSVTAFTNRGIGPFSNQQTVVLP